MVDVEQIKAYVDKVPPLPQSLKNSLKAIEDGDLPKAASFAKEDPALMNYLINLVNKPIFGFKKEIKDAGQIFGILGLNQAKQLIGSYLVALLSPKNWQTFKITNHKFNNLQAELMFNWNKILDKLNCNDKDVSSVAVLIPASIIVCEELFKNHIDDVNLLREVKSLDYNTILKRLTDKSLFDIATIIAKKWEMSKRTLKILLLSSGKVTTKEDDEDLIYAKYLHLLFFYQLSKPEMLEGGLNDFIEFNVEFVSDIYEDFQALMEIN